jgi:DNA polymerase III delta prime subunit
MKYPPPHYILFEPLDDKQTQLEWTEYKLKYKTQCEFTEVDASVLNTVDTFTPWFYNWISRVANDRSVRIRVLLIYHSEFLTFSCQQMIRRSLEQRSFKCRVWFHVEDPTTIQSAIQSRCIVKRMPTHIHIPNINKI